LGHALNTESSISTGCYQNIKRQNIISNLGECPRTPDFSQEIRADAVLRTQTQELSSLPSLLHGRAQYFEHGYWVFKIALGEKILTA